MQMWLLSKRTMVNEVAKHMNNATEVAKHNNNATEAAKQRNNDL